MPYIPRLVKTRVSLRGCHSEPETPAKQSNFELVTLWYFNIASENGSFIVYVPIVNGDFPQDR